MHLGYSPRLRIDHTSSEEIGQIYIPVVNWGLMLACIGLVVGFGSSSNLAAAYGVAVTTTMVITSLLFYVVARNRWKWGTAAALLLSGAFLVIDLSFFGANILKITHGGWFPLAIAAMVFTLMSTWKKGRRILAARLRAGTLPITEFLGSNVVKSAARVPGTAVFMNSNVDWAPLALINNLKYNRVLHERIIILTVVTEEIPHVPPEERVRMEHLKDGFYRVVVRYGFMEDPDVPKVLEGLIEPGFELDMGELIFFLARERLFATDKPGMAIWREKLFIWMSRNALGATFFFGIPPSRVVELGQQIEL